MSHTGTIIYMQSVPGHPNMRALSHPLSCQNQDGSDGEIPAGFHWDGSSTPFILRGIFPKFDHPIASCRHDWRCGHAQNAAERAWADKEFKKDVGTTSWKITAWVGYAGVRIGAFFGVGSNF